MTNRGWWTLFFASLMLLAGILRDVNALVLSGLGLLLWFGWEWLFFRVRLATLIRQIHIDREVWDDRGAISTLWAGREYLVRVTISLKGTGRFPWLSLRDPVPFALQHVAGTTRTDGTLSHEQPLSLEYSVHCPFTGTARFEGIRLEVSDLQGFFAAVTFLRYPTLYRILPAVIVSKPGGATSKRENQLPPPGIHRLRQPGSGSELLDLRDYMVGDPPRTIAWKISARRDRLITKEFESEVPIRCTLFLDTSSSVRVPSPMETRAGRHAIPKLAYFKPLDRLVELAAGVIRSCFQLRDLAGLCLIDEQGYRLVRPERTSQQQNRLLELLSDAASLSPMANRADPEPLLAVAYALAQEIYPDLLRNEVNKMPAWVSWLVGFPGHTAHRRGWFDWLHVHKRSLLLWGTTFIPLTFLVLNFLSIIFGPSPEWLATILAGLLVYGSGLSFAVTWLLFFLSVLLSGKRRRRAGWRKRLAAVMCVRAATTPTATSPLPTLGGIESLMEDDDLFSLHLQAFLGEHQVPVAVPLYDEVGRYLFAMPEKVKILSAAILDAVRRGRDNEFFILLIDLLELDGYLEPLLHAVRVALSRHHQFLLICPWPQHVPMPDEPSRRSARLDTLQGMVRDLTVKRMHEAYERIRRAFAGLGVPVICAENEDSLPLILRRVEQLRAGKIHQRAWSR